MSIFYKEKNTETVKELFEKKAFYKLSTNSDYPNLTDFEFAEKALYGRVDKFYKSIIPRDYFVELKRIPSDTDTPSSKYALNFVVDSFEKMRKQFQKKAMRGEIARSDEFLSDLAVFKAYINPVNEYDKHIASYMNAFEKIVRERNIKFLNFDQFVRKLMPYLKKAVIKRPFTMPAFVKSTYCPINCSGLVIEIADVKCDNDDEKIKKFYLSPNWEFYVNACNSMGFMVDKNNPWRLVADINSQEMLDASRVYGLTTTDEILNIGFKKAHRDYLDVFKVILFNMYNRLKRKRFSSLATVDQTGEKIITRTPMIYTFEQFTDQYDDDYFLNLYCQIRFSEEESHFLQTEQEKIIDNLLEISQINFALTVDCFENILNKTFDYRGSISYINSSLRKAGE